MVNFSSIPTEIITEIFVNLDYITLKLKLRGVCRRFRDIIKLAEDRRLRAKLFLPEANPSGSFKNDTQRQGNEHEIDGGTQSGSQDKVTQHGQVSRGASRGSDRGGFGRGGFGRGGRQPQVQESASEDPTVQSAATDRDYCYQIHPCFKFLKFKIIYEDLSTNYYRKSVDDVGFVHPLTGTFTSCGSTLLERENALSDEIPAEAFLEAEPEMPFFWSKGIKPAGFTVGQFVTALSTGCGVARIPERGRKACPDGLSYISVVDYLNYNRLNCSRLGEYSCFHISPAIFTTNQERSPNIEWYQDAQIVFRIEYIDQNDDRDDDEFEEDNRYTDPEGSEEDSWDLEPVFTRYK